MENFIDLFLLFLIVVIIVMTGGLIVLFIKDPITGYWVLWSGTGVIFSGIGLAGWKFYQKKRLGAYNETLNELTHIHKEIIRTVKHLEPSARKAIRTHFPQMRHLYHEAQRRIYKILDIEKDLRKIENQQFTKSISALPLRYQRNIATIEQARNQYLRDTQQIIRLFHEINSQLLALKYVDEQAGLEHKVAGMIDDLLIDMQTLQEITYNDTE